MQVPHKAPPQMHFTLLISTCLRSSMLNGFKKPRPRSYFSKYRLLFFVVHSQLQSLIFAVLGLRLSLY